MVSKVNLVCFAGLCLVYVACSQGSGTEVSVPEISTSDLSRNTDKEIIQDWLRSVFPGKDISINSDISEERGEFVEIGFSESGSRIVLPSTEETILFVLNQGDMLRRELQSAQILAQSQSDMSLGIFFDLDGNEISRRLAISNHRGVSLHMESDWKTIKPEERMWVKHGLCGLYGSAMKLPKYQLTKEILQVIEEVRTAGDEYVSRTTFTFMDMDVPATQIMGDENIHFNIGGDYSFEYDPQFREYVLSGVAWRMGAKIIAEDRDQKALIVHEPSGVFQSERLVMLQAIHEPNAPKCRGFDIIFSRK